MKNQLSKLVLSGVIVLAILGGRASMAGGEVVGGILLPSIMSSAVLISVPYTQNVGNNTRVEDSLSALLDEHFSKGRISYVERFASASELSLCVQMNSSQDASTLVADIKMMAMKDLSVTVKAMTFLNCGRLNQ